MAHRTRWATGALLPPAGLETPRDALRARLRGDLLLPGDDGWDDARRAEQQREWMWSMVDAELRAAARTTPGVAAQRGAWEAAVATGELDATEAAEKVLQALRSDWCDTP